MPGILVLSIAVISSLLTVAAVAYLMTTLRFGLLASTIPSTRQQAMFTVWFFLVFTIGDRARRVLKGAGFADLWPQLLALTGLGVAAFAAAVLRFGKRLD